MSLTPYQVFGQVYEAQIAPVAAPTAIVPMVDAAAVEAAPTSELQKLESLELRSLDTLTASPVARATTLRLGAARRSAQALKRDARGLLERKFDGRRGRSATSLVALPSAPEPQGFGWKLAAKERKATRMLEDLSQKAGMKTPAFYVRETPELNAWAYRRQKAIVISSALLNDLPDRELAAVLAHELGHFRGWFGRMISEVVVPTLAYGGAAGFLVSSFADPLASVLSGIASSAVAMIASTIAYHRNEEYAADALAVKLTGEKTAMIALLQRLAGDSRSPEAERRIKRITDRQAPDAPPPTNPPAAAFAPGLAFADLPMFQDLGWLQYEILGRPVTLWLASAGIAVGSIFVAKLTRALAARVLKKSGKDPLIQSFWVAAAGYAVYVIALAVIAGLWGMTLPGLLASVGVTAAVIAFPLSGPISNLAGGLTLLNEPPFREGDWIMVGAAEDLSGVVKNVTLFRTTLEGPKGIVTVPNSMFIDSVIVTKAVKTGDGPIAPNKKKAKGTAWYMWPLLLAAPIAWVAVQFTDLAIGRWLSVLAVIGTSWLVAKIVRGIVRLVLRKSSLDPMLKGIIASGAGLAVHLIASLVISQVIGMSFTQMFASFGVGPLVAGFVLRGPLGNLVGGLSILNEEERPFQVGDPIQLGADAGLSGKVEAVSLSKTRLQKGDRAYVVPNWKFVVGAVIKLNEQAAKGLETPGPSGPPAGDPAPQPPETPSK